MLDRACGSEVAGDESERQESLHDMSREGPPVLLGQQLVAGAGNGKKSGRGVDEAESGFDFGERAEGVAGAVYEEGWSLDGGKVAGAEIVRLLRRMEWVRKKEKTVHEAGLIGSEQRRLSTAIGVTAQKNAALGCASHKVNCGMEAEAVASGRAWAGRTVRADLAERHLAAQNGDAGGAKGFSQKDQERRAAV